MKTLILILTIATVMVLTSCGGSSQPSETTVDTVAVVCDSTKCAPDSCK